MSVESVYCHSGAIYFPFWREAKSFSACHELNFNNRLKGCFLSGGVDEIKGEFVKSRGVAGEVVEVQNGQAQHLMMYYFSKYSTILVHHEKWDYELRTTNLGVFSVALFDVFVCDSRLNSGYIKTIKHVERREGLVRGVWKDRVECCLFVADKGTAEK